MATTGKFQIISRAWFQPDELAEVSGIVSTWRRSSNPHAEHLQEFRFVPRVPVRKFDLALRIHVAQWLVQIKDDVGNVLDRASSKIVLRQYFMTSVVDHVFNAVAVSIEELSRFAPRVDWPDPPRLFI